MIQVAATIVFLIGIVGLFVLSRDGSRTSKALWIPIIWLFIAGSRPLSLLLKVQVISGTVDAQLDGSPFDRNIFTALIVAALVVLVKRRRKVAKLLQANAPILIYLAYCALSISWSDFPDVAFKRWIRALGDLSMVLVVLTDPSPFAGGLKTLLARAAFILIPLSLLSDLGRAASGLSYHFGLTTNKNMYGLICLVLAVGSLWRCLTIYRRDESRRRTKQLIAHGTVTAMATWCLWTANSTTATACFLIGSIILVSTTQWSFARKPMVVHLAVAALIFMTLYATVLNPDVGVVEAMGKDPTITGRTDVWNAVIGLNPSAAFGAGFESFWLGDRLRKLWTIFVWRPNEAHNGYIEVYLNLGFTGLFLLAILLAAGYRRVVQNVRQDTETGSLSLAYLVVVVIYNLTEAGFRIFSPAWIAVLLSVLAVFKAERQSAKSRLATRVSWHLPETDAYRRHPSSVAAVDVTR